MRAAGWSLASWRRDDAPPASGAAPQPSSPYDEDRLLVARMLAGDGEAVETFGARYGTALYRFAASRLGGDRDLVRDIVQTTLTKALARLDSYRGEAALLTWLCSCCRNEILMHRRRAGARVTLVEPEVLEAVPDAGRHADAEARLLDKERAERVHLTLDSLPERYAEVLEWKYVDHLPVETIAARLGLGLKAAESLLSRARRSFRNTFEDYARDAAGAAGVEPAPASIQP